MHIYTIYPAWVRAVSPKVYNGYLRPFSCLHPLLFLISHFSFSSLSITTPTHLSPPLLVPHCVSGFTVIHCAYCTSHPHLAPSIVPVMVRLLSSSITVLAMTIAVIQAQTAPAAAPGTINIKDFPPANQVPPVNSPQVQQWLKEIDLTGAPNIPLHKGDPPNCPNPPIKDEYV